MFTFFGQFFDHGLDLVNKGSGIVMVPLQADDPLVTHGTDGNAATTADNVPVGTPMILSRALPRARQLGSRQPDDPVRRPEPDLHLAPVAPGVPARVPLVGGIPRPTGRVLDGPGGNIGNWAEVKANALTNLGIILVDADIFNVPRLETDAYGHLRRNGAGQAQARLPNGTLVALNPATPIASSALQKINHEFLNDVAHSAVPTAVGPDTDNRGWLQPVPDGSPRAAMTTSCSTGTSSPVTAAATRTSR